MSLPGELAALCFNRKRAFFSCSSRLKLYSHPPFTHNHSFQKLYFQLEFIFIGSLCLNLPWRSFYRDIFPVWLQLIYLILIIAIWNYHRFMWNRPQFNRFVREPLSCGTATKWHKILSFLRSKWILSIR